jgi:hypothetical protein
MSIPQTDYSIKTKPIMPKYKFSKLYQQTGGQDVIVNASAQDSIFEIPARCLNLSRSTLNFKATMTALPGNYHWMYADVMAPIRQIQLYSRGGTYIINTNDVDRFSSVNLKAETTKKDSEVVDKDPDATVSTAIETFGRVCGSRQQTITPTLQPQVAAGAPDGGTFGGYVGNVVSALTVQNNGNPRYDGTNGNHNPFEPQYLRRSFNLNVDSEFNYEIPLSLFKGTAAELDKDFYFNEVLLLKITWNERANWGLTSTGVYAPAAASADIALDFEISNLALYLSLETEPNICAGLITMVRSGQLQTMIPFTHVFKNSAALNTSQNVSIRMNRAQGSHIKRIYHVIYNNTIAGITKYDHSNPYTLAAPGEGILSYYTSIDNDRRQEFDVNTSRNEDWLVVREHLSGTLVDRLDTYRNKWFVLDKFDDDDAIGNKVDCIASGLSLDVERKWDYIGTTGTVGTAKTHYTFVVVSRLLSITADGIILQ